MKRLGNAVPVHETLRETFDRQRHTFQKLAPLGYVKRIESLDALLHAIFKYEGVFIEALKFDFGRRSASETRLLEIFPLVDEIRYVKRNLRHWMKARTVSVNWQFLPSRAKVIYQPLGVVGVVGAWNYPVLLTLSPLINALAAGNHVMIKPSEIAPATAAAIEQAIDEIFPEEYVTVVTGDKEIAEAFSALPFDHLLYTGSGRVGRLVMKAAAENLTPVTLELGGKSPALVHESYSMATAAERICSAKFWNAGQTCVSPDYALVPSHKIEEFVRESTAIIAKRYPRLVSNDDYTHMISEAAWQRMQGLVADVRDWGAQIIQPHREHEAFTAESRIFPPTLVVGANSSMRVMQEEIFGPILPVVPFSTLEDGLAFINSRPRPLALYYFDRNSSRIKRVLEQTVSGGVTVNDCIFHLPQHRLPFGGVGPSGMGSYHGFDGFATFSKKKGVLLQNELVGSILARILKPPYSSLSDRMIRSLLRRSRPRPIRRITLAGEK
ncbi:MAG: coniferyl aldehyde dehydrogenase [Silvibacterium sp.]|nr:coniferyl aldehyde dehydrogenase [Silvibacterium sp.]MBV8437066.1 coniferyl aldehyde dehydrogenase [Silvibacterium sp.]